MDRSLTLLNETPAFTVSGDAIAALGGSDILAVRIAGPATLSEVAQGDPALSARLIAGATMLDEGTTSLRFVALNDVLPWVVLAVFVIVAAVLAVWYARRRKARPAA